MAITAAGASDHFTKIAEKEMAMIPITRKIGIGIFVGFIAFIISYSLDVSLLLVDNK
ncbi:hypothetical protein D3C86_2055260 [compost metagenome]